MSSFLGPLGSLIPMKCASRLAVSGGRDVTLARTLGSQKAFLGQVRARQWDVVIGLAKPAELSGLSWLAEYSDEPLVWYSPDATVGNILSPDLSGLYGPVHDGMEGPLIEVEPGVFVKSALPEVDVGYFAMPRISPVGSIPVPVPAGATVTASMWVRGPDARVSITWWDALKNSVGFAGSDYLNLPEFERISVTAVAPPGATGLTMSLRGTQVAGPAVTLTDELMPYSPGQGAFRTVVHGLDKEVLRATTVQQLSALSFVISEVQ